MKMMKLLKNKYDLRLVICLAGISFAGVSCMDQFIPDSLDAFDQDAGFTQLVYKPKLGRSNVFTDNYNSANSTLPMTFEITSITRKDGSPAPELTDNFPVKVWKKPYLGTERSVAEIEAKRGIEYRPLFQVHKHSGNFVMWAEAVSSFVKCSPAECYVFDVLAQNSGGYKYTTRMELTPEREADYEPSNYDPETGLATSEYLIPTSVRYLYTTDNFFMLKEEVHIYIKKNEESGNKEKTLTFRFYDAEYNPINPTEFNETKWADLAPGLFFDMEKTTEYVRYKVPYPLPLIEMPLSYTNKTGDQIHVSFKASRLSYSGYRITPQVDFDFAIYTEGDWEIIFVFSSGRPLLGE